MQKIKDKTFTKLPKHPHTVFDEDNFLEMLNKSVALTYTEKERAVKAVSQLNQEQIDYLIRTLEEEKRKFAEKGLDMEQVRLIREKPFSIRQMFFNPALNPFKFLRPSNITLIFKVLKEMSGFSGKKNR